MTIRAKFHCHSVTQFDRSREVRTYRFRAVYDRGPADEDRAFAQATPTGTLELQVDDPRAEFEVNRDYYLDLTPVDASPVADAQ